MMKYIIIFAMLVSILSAQELNLPGSLDQPLKQSSNISAMFSVKVTGQLFNGFSIQTIINQLLNPQIITHHSYFVSRWVTNTPQKDALLAELTQYQQALPQYMEPITNGTIAYYDWYGTNMQPADADAQAGLDNTLKNGRSDFVSSSLTLYAGRNTAAGGGLYASSGTFSELELTTNSGNKYTIFAYDETTPLVLDMDGDNKLEASNGQWLPHATTKDSSKLVEFDINADGFEETIEWVGPNDGLLVSNYNPSQKATGACLFGNATGYTHGFEMLASLDANHDTKITGEELNTLSVWQDKNGNARMDAGEVTPIQELGITELNTIQTAMVSYYVRDGKNYLMWDWYPATFMAKKMQK